MILILLILVPLAGGLVAWLLGRRAGGAARWTALAALTVDAALVLGLWAQGGGGAAGGTWLAEVRQPWIPQLGVSFLLALDGLSLLLVALTVFLGLVAVLASWSEIREREGFFYFNLLWTLAGIVGVFAALDLFLFYFFWELMLVPMYFLIAIWGHERRIYAAMKFFVFTQASGLLMLLAILALYFLHGRDSGVYTFDYTLLVGAPLAGPAGALVMWGFLAAFLVKLPALPVHSWLPDAHSQAPTAGSVVLAGLLLKTGAYGLLRFVLPLFPGPAADLAPAMLLLGAAGVIYGALLAFAQTDLKRLVAYTSVSHMGFVLMGAFAFSPLAMQGAVLQIICHGISTGALFVLAGMLYERMHTRDITRMGGLWHIMPRIGAAAMLFAMASLGLPGLGNFLGEFLVLMGAYQSSATITVVASLGLVAATVYSLWLLQRAFFGRNEAGWRLPDMGAREAAALAALAVAIVWLGVYPQPVLDTAAPALERVQQTAAPHDRVGSLRVPGRP
ncbi:MAG TPA: NADH-quinone oxidoreductase subunit M [Roseiflexaceae bacterium]|nr:NADH-quinone oxidoreductase subunit M [Roseiflexaceae bacterium]